ncbi:MAG: type II toxin-antitoxin system VapB family antitoxin [Planctomycetes bacterium]|nr:type II toxin-antitoxin system VapB family antitoxin [Planctomycetota bacterium]
MGRTNIVIDDSLVRRVMKILGVTTKRRAVDTALRRLADQETTYAELRRLRGKLHWKGDIAAGRRNRLAPR